MAEDDEPAADKSLKRWQERENATFGVNDLDQYRLGSAQPRPRCRMQRSGRSEAGQPANRSRAAEPGSLSPVDDLAVQWAARHGVGGTDEYRQTYLTALDHVVPRNGAADHRALSGRTGPGTAVAVRTAARPAILIVPASKLTRYERDLLEAISDSRRGCGEPHRHRPLSRLPAPATRPLPALAWPGGRRPLSALRARTASALAPIRSILALRPASRAAVEPAGASLQCPNARQGRWFLLTETRVRREGREMPASAARPADRAQQRWRLWWLPSHGTGNGLSDTGWAPVADIDSAIVAALLGELRAAGVPAHAALVTRRPALPRSRLPASSEQCRLWVGTSAYSRAEDILRIRLPVLRRHPAS